MHAVVNFISSVHVLGLFLVTYGRVPVLEFLENLMAVSLVGGIFARSYS